MKHTSGPWTIDTPVIGAPIISGKGWMGERRIAKVLYEGGLEDPEVRGNALLVVAALDSHKANKEALALLDIITNPLMPFMLNQQYHAHAELLESIDAVRNMLRDAIQKATK